MKDLKKRLKNEDGELMLEALIVYGVTLMLLFFMLALFSLLYQRWNIQIIANDTAMRIGQNYKYFAVEVDDFSGIPKSTVDKVEANKYSEFKSAQPNELGSEFVTAINPYRYISLDFSTEEILDIESNEGWYAYKFAKGRLAKTSYVHNVEEPNVTVTVFKDSLARKHVEVTISGAYSVPLGSMLAAFGLPGVIEYETTGRAVCVDIVNYINTIDYVDTLVHTNYLGGLGDMVNSATGLVDSVRKFIIERRN